MKEVQQLTGRLAALSRFMSAGGEKGHPYFQCLKRNSRFVWTKECEEAFVKLKEYLASPPVLCKPQVGTPPSVLCCDRESGKFGVGPRTEPGSETYLFRE